MFLIVAEWLRQMTVGADIHFPLAAVYRQL